MRVYAMCVKGVCGVWASVCEWECVYRCAGSLSESVCVVCERERVGVRVSVRVHAVSESVCMLCVGEIVWVCV